MEVKISARRTTTRGNGIVWIQCPLEAANNIIKKKVIIGWSAVYCALLENRPMRCYRCLETGHSRYNCNSEIDRSDRCFNCGETGHVAAVCREKSKCMICQFYGKTEGHKLGGNKCIPPTKSERRAAANRRQLKNKSAEESDKME